MLSNLKLKVLVRIKDQIFVGNPQAGLNYDDDPRWFRNGETNYRKNAAPFDDSTQGLITNMRGNEDISHSFDHDVAYGGSTYTVIGGCYDEKRNAFYYFIYSDGGNDCIVRYNIDAGDYDKIVWDSEYLNFSLSYPITDAFVMGDYLCFNPRGTTPRMLNITWCTNYYDYDLVVGGNTYDSGDTFRYAGRVFECLYDSTSGANLITDADNGEYELCRWTGEAYLRGNYDYMYNTVYQPKSSIVAVYGNDSSRSINNLKQSVFQFSYRYVYVDGRTSLYAPYTEAVFQGGNESYIGDLGSAILVNNKLTLSVGFYAFDGFYSRYVLNYVEIIFRESTSTGWGTWKLAGKLDWNDIINLTDFVFYNDQNYDVVDQYEVSRQYNNIPISTKAQVPLKDNRVGYVGVTQGYDNITPNVVLSSTFIEDDAAIEGDTVDAANSASHAITEYTTTTPGRGETIYSYKTESITSVPDDGDYVIIVADNVVTYLQVDSDIHTSAPVYRAALADRIERDIGGAQALPDQGDSDDQVLIYFTPRDVSHSVSIIVYNSVTALSTAAIGGFKTGAKHKFCIFYYDSLLRKSTAIEHPDLEVYLPSLSEQAVVTPPTAGDILRYNIAWTIKHLPPTWARYWRFGYAGNTSISKFWQYTVSSAEDKNDTGGNRIYDDTTYPQYGNYTEICIDPLQFHKDESGSSITSLEQSFPNSNIDIYDFQEGDRIRFLATCDGSGNVSFLTTVHDYEIKAYAESAASGSAACVFIEDLASIPIGARSIVEIYRPIKSTSETIYYEYGPLMNTYTDSDVLYHAGQTQNQDSSNDATGVFTNGDVYHVLRAFSYVIDTGNLTSTFPVESFSVSDFYDGAVWSQGRIGVASSIGQVESNNIVYSNVLVEGTRINGLSDFDFDNYKDVTSLHGDVYAARALGNVLKMITDSKVISAGMGIREYTDASGQTTFASSDSVIGYQRVSADSYGTINPESVSVVDGALYFWDYKNGCIVRDSGNGLFPVSGKYMTATGGTDHKMRTFFRQMKETIRSNTYTGWLAWSGYERNYDLLYFYFKDTTDATNNVIISYHISTGRWFCNNHIWSDASGNWPYYIGGGGRFFSSTLGEDVYMHYSASSNRCTYYGSAKPFELRVFTSEANSEVKIYDRFGIQANSKPTVNDITVTTLEDGDGEMKSKIPANWLEKIENGYYAPFLRNMATYTSYSSADTSTNIITGWTQNTWDSLTSTGADIDLGAESGDAVHGYSNSFSVTANMTYKISYNLTLNGGTAPNLRIGTTFGSSTLLGQMDEGANTFEYTATAAASGVEVYIENESGNTTSFSCTFTMTETEGKLKKGLISGDYLRGNSLRLDLDYATATSEITVYKVVIGSELSNI